MGKATGFLEYTRTDNRQRPPKERVGDFNEFRVPLPDDERRLQSARCMNCGVPLCQSAMVLSGMVTGCPLHNLIPEWNDELYQGHTEHAVSRLLKTAPFPEFTGRVCPALCEKACTCGLYDDPVSIHDNELYLIEYAFSHGLMKPHPPAVRSGKKVAVVGSGPSGLACAQRLNARGHLVTVFEREDRIGGLLMYGIPNMKLDKRIIFRRQALMEAEGIVFKTGVNVVGDIPDEGFSSPDKAAFGTTSVRASALLSEYDAVVLACGAKKARGLAVDGFENTKGIAYAVDFLKGTTRALLQEIGDDPSAPAPASLLPKASQKGFLSAKGKHVVIVGGGDTGNDCAGTCIRQGCKSLTQLEMMPAPPVMRLPSNPWPEWPKVLKTDYGQEEAISLFGHDPRIYETTVKRLITKKDKLTAIETVNVRFEGRKLVEIPGSEETLPCDLLLIAAGFVGCEDYVAEAFSLARTPRGTAASPEGSYHAIADVQGGALAEQSAGTGKLFTCGDMRRGQSLVVWALTEGRACAREVDEFLMGYTNLI